MPKITRVTGPSVQAPDLTQAPQRINIPRGAFGEKTAEATKEVGRAFETSAKAAAEVYDRHKLRADTTAATNLYANLPIEELNHLEAYKKAAQKDAALLPDFQRAFTEQQSARINEAAATLPSKRSQRLYLDAAKKLRIDHANKATLFALLQQVTNGRNAMNAALDGIVKTAAFEYVEGGLPAIEKLYENVKAELTRHHNLGHNLDYRQRPKDFNTTLTERYREIDVAVANSLMYESPGALKDLLEKNQLKYLTEKEKRIFEFQADESLSTMPQRAMLAVLEEEVAELDKIGTLHKQGQLYGKKGYDEFTNAIHKYATKIADYKVAAEDLSKTGGSAAWIAHYNEQIADAEKMTNLLSQWRAKLSYKPIEVQIAEKAEDKAVDVLASTAVQEFLISNDLPQYAKGGNAKGILPSKQEQALYYDYLNTTFLGMAKKYSSGSRTRKSQYKLKDKATSLRQIITLKSDAEYGLAKGLLTKDQYLTITDNMASILDRKVKQRDFSEPQKSALKGVNTAETTPKDYSDQYLGAVYHVLRILDDNPAINTMENRAAALVYAYQIANSVDRDEEESIYKHRINMVGAGKQAMKQLFRDLIPAINDMTDENFPDFVVHNALLQETTPDGGKPAMEIPDQSQLWEYDKSTKRYHKEDKYYEGFRKFVSINADHFARNRFEGDTLIDKTWQEKKATFIRVFGSEKWEAFMRDVEKEQGLRDESTIEKLLLDLGED